MSSYKVDSKTNLPILYLQDDKQTLWKKFSETYSNGIKKTSFMGRLQDGPYRYREDLGGLCNICSEYFYNVFEELVNLIRNYAKDNINQVCYIYIFDLFSHKYL